MRSNARRCSAGGLGEDRDGGGGAGEAELVAGEGGEVAEEALEAAVGPAAGVVLAGCLGVGGCRAPGGGNGAGGLGWFLVGVGQRRPGLAQVPGEVGGEHADQHVGPDALFEAVEDGAQVEVVGFDVPEVALDVLEVLVGGHGAGRVEVVGGERGADDVDPVEPGFLLDLVLLPLDGEAVIGDGDGEVLGHLVLADDLARPSCRSRRLR